MGAYVINLGNIGKKRVKKKKLDQETSTHPDLKDQTLLRSNKINEIEDYFIAGIREREKMSKILSKYIAAFDYIDKILFYLQRSR